MAPLLLKCFWTSQCILFTGHLLNFCTCNITKGLYFSISTSSLLMQKQKGSPYMHFCTLLSELAFEVFTLWCDSALFHFSISFFPCFPQAINFCSHTFSITRAFPEMFGNFRVTPVIFFGQTECNMSFLL